MSAVTIRVVTKSSGAAWPNWDIDRNVDYSMVVWDIPCKFLKLIGIAHLQCPGIDWNADDWVVVSVGALYLYGASAAAYAGKTLLRM